MAQDCANLDARAGTPQNQITFEMLTGTGQIEAIEAQIQCPPLLHEQLKKKKKKLPLKPGIKLLLKKNLKVVTLDITRT